MPLAILATGTPLDIGLAILIGFVLLSIGLWVKGIVAKGMKLVAQTLTWIVIAGCLYFLGEAFLRGTLAAM